LIIIPFTTTLSQVNSLSLSISLPFVSRIQAFSISSLSIPSILQAFSKHSSLHCLLFASQIQAFSIPLPFVCKSDSSILHSLAFLFSSLIKAFFIPLPSVFKSN
jgi:hypothetical protein